MLLEPPPHCKGSKDRLLLASPSSAVTHLMGQGISAAAGLPQGLKQAGFLCKQPSSALHNTSSPWSQELRPSDPAASLPPGPPACALRRDGNGKPATASSARPRPHVWLVAAAAFLDNPLISSEAARFNSLHFGIKSGSHPESNLCVPEQAVVTFPIKM